MLRRLFVVWCCLAAIGISIVLSTAIGADRVSVASEPTFEQVRHLLNWSEVGESQFERVLHSYESPLFGLEGDYSKAYAIKLKNLPSGFNIAERRELRPSWHHLPLENWVLKDAFDLGFSIREADEQRWIPEASTVISPKFIARFQQFTFYTSQSEYVGLFVLDTQDLILYYLEVKI